MTYRRFGLLCLVVLFVQTPPVLSKPVFPIQFTLEKVGKKPVTGYEIIGYSLPEGNHNYGILRFARRNSWWGPLKEFWPIRRAINLDRAAYSSVLFLLDHLSKPDTYLRTDISGNESLSRVGRFNGKAIVKYAWDGLQSMALGVVTYREAAPGVFVEIDSWATLNFEGTADAHRGVLSATVRPWTLGPESPRFFAFIREGAPVSVNVRSWKEKTIEVVTDDGRSHWISLSQLRILPPDVVKALDTLRTVSDWLPSGAISTSLTGGAEILARLFPNQTQEVVRALTFLPEQVPGVLGQLLPDSLDAETREAVLDLLSPARLKEGWAAYCANALITGSKAAIRHFESKP